MIQVTKVIALNLNQTIDLTTYPVPQAAKSNLLHRPIGIGVQGLADVFQLLHIPYTSPEAQLLNAQIFETIYHSALDASCCLAQRDGPYETFHGSQLSKGILHFDHCKLRHPLRCEWDGLRDRIKRFGVRNSLVTAAMPTSTTSQILGCTESFEPISFNLYNRRTNAGEFVVVNKHLVDYCYLNGIDFNLVRDYLVEHSGSIQGCELIPEDAQQVFKTVWEMKGRTLLDMAIDRGAFLDQSQSLNCFMHPATPEKLTAMHFYGWKGGLKTGMYYLRTRPAAHAIQFTKKTTRVDAACAIGPSGTCESCEG